MVYTCLSFYVCSYCFVANFAIIKIFINFGTLVFVDSNLIRYPRMPNLSSVKIWSTRYINKLCL